MNKHVFAAACVAALCAACAQQPKDRFTLDGTVEGWDGQYVYLTYHKDSVKVEDSTLVQGGKFHFEGSLQRVTSAMLNGKLTGDIYVPGTLRTFYMEPAAMTIALDTADLSKSIVEGSVTQAGVDSLEAQREAIMAEAKSINDAIMSETDHEKQAELREQLEPYQERANKLYDAYIVSHPASVAAADYMQFRIANMAFEEAQKLYDAFTPEVKQTLAAQEIAKELDVLARIQPGQPAPDFEATDVNGKPFRLSDLRGNYVVIDFWASWCVPCRKSNPHMKEMYAKYHDKGLEYVYVADNDNQPDAWRKAIEEDGLEAFHHVLRGLKIDRSNGGYNVDRTNDISDKYAIHFLPTKYLIDREGNIVGKLDSDELDAKLKEIFE